MSIVTKTIDTAQPAPTTPIVGLTEREVTERRARGEGNKVQMGTSRSYVQILRQNAFTFINNILFAIAITLIIMGRIDDAAVTGGVMLLNIIVGVVQEGRAKKQLDQIALLTRPKAAVVRDGIEKTIDPGELVLGDVLVVGPGDQIVVDGEVVGDGRMDVDESQLTGESDLIPKRAGDEVFSGSFCVTGKAMYVATKVGAQSFANQITAGARAFRQVKTPLQRDVDYTIRLLIVMVTVLGLMLIGSYIIASMAGVDIVRNAAVIVGLVPQGLFFMIAVSYAVGAVRMSGKGALVQQANAVESMSNVNVLCLDKTGTLTTNAIKLHAIHPLGIEEAEFTALLGDYAASGSVGNKTSEAIAEALPGNKRPIHDEVPFSSARKWSAVALATDDGRQTTDDGGKAESSGIIPHSAIRTPQSGVFVLGAPEMLMSNLQPGADLGAQSEEWTALGLRVLLFAYTPEVVPLYDDTGEPKLPAGLIPLGLISFSDVLRPDAQLALKGFSEAGIRLKIISGDNPHTVAALARQAGFAGDLSVVSGLQLDEMDDDTFTRTAEETTVFGRITPQQKEKLVRILRGKGYYVAMIGDGVNDVLSLKQANLGISMQSGSQATRGVADMVLLNDAFSILPNAFKEGQRIINGMHDVVRLLLARTLYLIFLMAGVAMLGLKDAPLTPKHNSILAVLTVGIPTVALVAWARIGEPPKRLLRSVLGFVIPAAVTIAAVALAVYTGYVINTNALNTNDFTLAQTALTTVTVLCGLVLIPFAEPPTPGWVAGDEYSGDKRPTILAVAMLAIFVIIMLVPATRTFFVLAPLGLFDIALIAAVVVAWAFALRYIWRGRILEKIVREDA
ncbi:MAG TPA: HAD-IC family P-type ATPase [Chloroflexia bacterium]|nr:HAD-IC family P-type ATPase [Chloroflexia bacterium]